MKLSKAQESLELGEIGFRLERLVKAAKEYDEALLQSQDITDDELENLKLQFMHDNEISYGVVFLGSEYDWIDGDTKLFMRFAKWWLQGAMSDEMFDLFIFHYEEVIEIDYAWVLTNKPSFYYFQEKSREDYESQIQTLREIGTRDKKVNKAINFKLKLGHGDYIR